MLKDITLGQFFPGNSVLHRLDPRAKIVLMIMYIVALFLADNFISYALMAAVTLTLIAVSRIPLKLYVRGLKPLMIIICFTAILNLFYSSGNVLVSFWIFKITDTGVYNAVTMVSRIMMLVITTSMLTYTTSPIVLTGGLERLLSPLKVIKVPVHEFSMMMTIALRFIPTLLEETEKIMNAQKARGADFETGGIIKRAKALIPILIPLFVSAFRRADELATAMECRCYSGEGKGRTHLVQYKMKLVDYLGFFLVALLIAAIVVIGKINLGLTA